MKKILLVSATLITLLSNACLASTNPPANNVEEDLLLHGPYVGVAFGWNNPSQFNSTYSDEIVADGNLFLGGGYDFQPFVGYRFTDHIALEAGYSYPNDISGQTTPQGKTTATYHYNVQGGNLQLMLNTMVGHYLNIYAKGGFAIMHADVHDEYSIAHEKDFSTTQTAIVPVIGAGADLVVAKRWTIGPTVSYQAAHDFIPANTFVGLRTSFTF